MKLITLFLIVLNVFTTKIIAQGDIVETDSLLLWQADRKLTWDDFKGNTDERQINKGAITRGRIATINIYWENNMPMYDIRCYFVKYNSWNIVTDSLSLMHEQVHFDIFELYTRKIRKAFDKLNQDKVTDYNTYNNLFQSYFKECSQLHQEYDIDSFDKDTLPKWINRVAKELEQLKDYEYIPNQ